MAKILEQNFSVKLHSFGCLSPIDWYAVSTAGRVVGLCELKSRSHESARFPTVFLNVRKWLALHLAANGMGVPAIFVVQFTDEVRWIRVTEIDATRVRMGGCSRQVKSRSDVEPVIEVDVAQMRTLKVPIVDPSA